MPAAGHSKYGSRTSGTSGHKVVGEHPGEVTFFMNSLVCLASFSKRYTFPVVTVLRGQGLDHCAGANFSFCASLGPELGLW